VCALASPARGAVLAAVGLWLLGCQKADSGNVSPSATAIKPLASEAVAAPIALDEPSDNVASANNYGDMKLLLDLPTKEWEAEHYPAEEVRNMASRWRAYYEGVLSDMSIADDSPGRSAPKLAYLKYFHAPKMKWFLQTPNVSSYEEQLRIVHAFFEGKTWFEFVFGLPCRVGRPIGGPDGTNVDCHGAFYSKWFERVPTTWKGCQSEHVPRGYNAAMGGAPGSMWRKLKWTTKLHLTPNGQVDVFHLQPVRAPDRTVNSGQTARCTDEPHWNPKAPSVSSREVAPGDVLGHVGKDVLCMTKSKSRRLTAVNFQGRECWVESRALTDLVPLEETTSPYPSYQ